MNDQSVPLIAQVRAWFNKKDKSVVEEYLQAAIKVLPVVFVIRTFLFGLYVVPTGSMENQMLVGERFFADKLTIWFTPIKRGEVISLNDPTYAYATNALQNIWQRYVWGPSSWTKRVIGVPGDHVQGRVEDGKPVVYVNEVRLDEPYVNQYPLIYMWEKRAPDAGDERHWIYGRDEFRINRRTFDPERSFADQIFYTVHPDLVVRGDSRMFRDASYDAVHDCWLRMPEMPSSDGKDVFDVHLGPNEYWLMGDNRQNSQDSREFGKVSGSLIHGRIKCRFFSLQYGRSWSFLIFDESWWLLDMLVNPINFWQRVRWSRCCAWIR